MATNQPDLLLEEAFRGTVRPGQLPLVDAPRTEVRPEASGFDWRPTILIVSLGAAAFMAGVYLL